jgi:hypothetical protein
MRGYRACREATSLTFASKAKLVLTGCIAVGVFNAVLLTHIGPTVRRNRQTEPLHLQFVSARALCFRPVILLPCLIFLFGMTYWALRPSSGKYQETTRLLVLAAAACALIGILLTWTYDI